MEEMAEIISDVCGRQAGQDAGEILQRIQVMPLVSDPNGVNPSIVPPCLGRACEQPSLSARRHGAEVRR